MSYEQELEIRNWNDENGDPGGGTAEGNGVSIRWQNGTVPEKGENGAHVETVIAAAIKRLEFFEESKFYCLENSTAIIHLKDALKQLKNRDALRRQQGIAGKHTKHYSPQHSG